MKYRKLAGTNLQLSVLGIGCSSYWALKETPEDKALEVLKTGYDLGINFFDTGSSYADGNAERRLGKFLSTIPRKDIVISTKAGTIKAQMGKATKDFSSKAIRESVQSSLERLNTEYIDILFLHSPSIQDITQELLEELNQILLEKKVRYIGIHSSNNEVLEYAIKIQVFSVFLSDYNLLRAELNIFIDKLAILNKGFIAATPLAQMLFTKKIFFPKSRKDIWYLLRALKNRRVDLIKGFKLSFAAKIPNLLPNEVAINYVLSNKHVTSAVFGTTNVNNVISNTNALGKELDKEIINRINKQ